MPFTIGRPRTLLCTQKKMRTKDPWALTPKPPSPQKCRLMRVQALSVVLSAVSSATASSSFSLNCRCLGAASARRARPAKKRWAEAERFFGGTLLPSLRNAAPRAPPAAPWPREQKMPRLRD